MNNFLQKNYNSLDGAAWAGGTGVASQAIAARKFEAKNNNDK